MQFCFDLQDEDLVFNDLYLEATKISSTLTNNGVIVDVFAIRSPKAPP